MRKYLVTFYILFNGIYSYTAAQDSINSITKLNGWGAIFTESTWNNDTLYIAGTVFTDEGRSGLIAKYLSDGSFLGFKNLIDSFTDFGISFWDKGLFIQNDTIYHIGGKGFAGTLLNGLILKMDLNGNLLQEKEYTSVYYPNDDFCRFKDFLKTNSGFAILDYGRKTETDFQSCLIKTDFQFNEKWRKCFGNTSLEIPKDLLVTSRSNLITLANGTNLDIGEQYTGSGNGYYRGYIFETDSLGNLKWEWRSSSKMEAVYAGIIENDSTLVVAAGAGKEYCSDSQSNALCYFIWTGKAFKLDLNTREKIWETSLSGGPHVPMNNNRYLDIISSIEKDGYILCGAGYDYVSGCEQIDTTVKCWSFPGVIAKVSNDGDSLWMRKYFGVTDIYESNTLYDAEITPDSGYSFVGEAINPWPGETQGQHGWLLITDKYGCLVPGCQLISSTQESEARNELLKSPMKIYPNPVVNQINVLITGDVSAKTELKLFNSMGIELDSWTDLQKEGTYLIPANQYPSGSYYMLLVEEDRVLATQEIIKPD